MRTRRAPASLRLLSDTNTITSNQVACSYIDSDNTSGGRDDKGTCVFPHEDACSLQANCENAARILQRNVHVWLLAKRERESLANVAALRRQLHEAAADEIACWWRRWLRRRSIERWLVSYDAERAGAQISTWIHCHHRRRTLLWRLREQLDAQRRMVWWWRRCGIDRKCSLRRREAEETRRRAAAIIYRAFRSWHRRQKRVASRRVGTFLSRCVRRRRIRHLLARRAAANALHITMGMCVQRQALDCWRRYTDDKRYRYEERRDRAASVLQRLFRVMLTAFRLMRRRDAATRLQSIFRGHHVRRELHHRRCESLALAAMCLQRHVRGFLARHRVHRLLHQLRDRFRCANCGLVEPGGRYCKLCGRRRTALDALGAVAVPASDTTDVRLRLRRVRGAIEEPPPQPPPAPSASRSVPSPTVINVMLPLLHARGALHRPHKPTGVPRGLLNARHRSFSTVDAAMASAHNTRQRAERLLVEQVRKTAQSPAMRMHMRRLEAAAKVASR